MNKKKTLTISPGKNRWITQLVLIIFFQLLFYTVVVLTVYSFATLHWKLILILLTISIIQFPFRRSDLYIKLVNEKIKPLWYFKSFKRIYEQPIKDSEKCMFCMHPHSIFSYCVLSNMNADSSKMSTMTGLASRFIFNTPIIGLIFRMWGVDAVNPQNMKQLMKKDKTIGLVPGGYEEATLTTPKQLRIFTRQRAGFIYYALKYGYTIYPVLNLNQHRAFWTFDYFTKFRLFLNKLKIPTVFFAGGFLSIFFPTNVDYVVIVGKGIRRKKQYSGKPSHEQVDEAHQQYIKQLKRIHKKYKKLGGNVDLVFY